MGCAKVVLIAVLVVVLANACCGDYIARTHRVQRRHNILYNPLNFYNLWAMRSDVETPRAFPSMHVHFPNHEVLRSNWQAIRDEALAAQKAGHTTVIHNDPHFRNIADQSWTKLYLRWYGDYLPSARERCPMTCQLLDTIPEVHLAMISILGPGGVIRPHRGPSKGCVRYHLGLQCPADGGAVITVDGEEYHYRDGEDVLLDDTYVHKVRNTSNTSRIILFCDVERRMRTNGANNFNRWMCNTLGPLSNSINQKNESASYAKSDARKQ